MAAPRILLTRSSPDDQGPIDGDDETSKLEDVAPFVLTEKVKVKLWQVGDLLRRGCEGEGLVILHVSSHGTPNGSLVFAEESQFDGKTISVEADVEAFAALVAGLPSVSGVVLSACNSVRQAKAIVEAVGPAGAGDAFIPAPFAIGFDGAHAQPDFSAFARVFYLALARGVSVQEAFDHAKQDARVAGYHAIADAAHLAGRPGHDLSMFRIVHQRKPTPTISFRPSGREVSGELTSWTLHQGGLAVGVNAGEPMVGRFRVHVSSEGKPLCNRVVRRLPTSVDVEARSHFATKTIKVRVVGEGIESVDATIQVAPKVLLVVALAALIASVAPSVFASMLSVGFLSPLGRSGAVIATCVLAMLVLFWRSTVTNGGRRPRWIPSLPSCFAAAFFLGLWPFGGSILFGRTCVNCSKVDLTCGADRIPPGEARLGFGANPCPNLVLEDPLPGDGKGGSVLARLMRTVTRAEKHAYCEPHWSGIAAYKKVDRRLKPRVGTCEPDPKAEENVETVAATAFVPSERQALVQDIELHIAPSLSSSAKDYFDLQRITQPMEAWRPHVFSSPPADLSLKWTENDHLTAASLHLAKTKSAEVLLPARPVEVVLNGARIAQLKAGPKCRRLGFGTPPPWLKQLDAGSEYSWSSDASSPHWVFCQDSLGVKTGELVLRESGETDAAARAMILHSAMLPSELTIKNGEQTIGTLTCDVGGATTILIGRRAALPQSCSPSGGELRVGVASSKWTTAAPQAERWYCWPEGARCSRVVPSRNCCSSGSGNFAPLPDCERSLAGELKETRTTSPQASVDCRSTAGANGVPARCGEVCRVIAP